MTDLNNKNVHELIMEIYYAGANSQPDRRQEAENYLRYGVIKEAGVGKLIFGTREVYFVGTPDYSHVETTVRWNWFENKRRPDVLTEDLLLIPVLKEPSCSG